MKISSIVCASFAALVVSAFAADGAFAKNISDGAAKGQANEGTAPATTSCTTGYSWDAATKKCVATTSINYNASKSNTGSVTATPLNNRSNVSGSAQPASTGAPPPPK
jgi:hypothetical protein